MSIRVAVDCGDAISTKTRPPLVDKHRECTPLTGSVCGTVIPLEHVFGAAAWSCFKTFEYVSMFT